MQFVQEVAAPRHVAVKKARTSFEDLPRVITEGLNEVFEFLEKSSVDRTGQAIVYYPVGHGDMIEVEVGVEVAGPFESEGPVVASKIPGGRVVKATHVGAYAEMHRTHRAVMDWCETNALEIAGPNWEIYGDWTEDESQLRTDVYYLLK